MSIAEDLEKIIRDILDGMSITMSDELVKALAEKIAAQQDGESD